MVLPLLGALAGGLFQAASAKSAARAQEAAARDQTALQGRMYDETVGRFAPFYGQGLDYANALRFELLGGDRPMVGGTAPGITEEQYQVAPAWARAAGQEGNDYIVPAEQGTRYRVGDQVFDTRDAAQAYANANPTGGTPYAGFTATPGYDWQVREGQRAIDSSAASRGQLFSSNTLRNQMNFRQGMAAQEYNNYLNRLAGGAASGQNAAGNLATAATNNAAMGTQALSNLGNAQAAGAIGFGNAISGGIGNAIGMWNYQNMQQAQPAAGGFTSNNILAPMTSIRPMARPF